MRVDGDLLTLEPLDAVLVEPDSARQVFNDTAADQLWFVAGAPLKPANTLEMTPEQLAALYPDGPKALPPELIQPLAHPRHCGRQWGRTEVRPHAPLAHLWQLHRHFVYLADHSLPDASLYCITPVKVAGAPLMVISVPDFSPKFNSCSTFSVSTPG